MPIQSIEYVSESTSSSNVGFFFPKSELPFVISQSVINYPFGQFDTNVIEFSVYNLSDDLLAWKTIDPQREYTPIHRTFVDLNNILQSYTYNQIKQSFFVLNGQKQVTKSNADEIVVDPIGDLASVEFTDGSYRLVYTPLDNVVGSMDSGSRLLIKDISPSRKELKIIPTFPKNSDDIKDIKSNDQYNLFISRKVKIKTVIGDILKNTRSPRISNLYYEAVPNSEVIISEMKLNYSFKSDNDFILFLQNTYQVVSDQFENFLYLNYENNANFIDIESEYSGISNYVIQRELTKIRNTLTDAYKDSYTQYVSFIFEIFDSVLNLVDVEGIHEKRYGTYFKNVLNFGKGKYLPILNWKLSNENVGDESKQNIVLIKLKDALPDDISIKDSFWISNLSISLPIIQNVIVFKQSNIQTIKLRGPNFRTRIENLGESTKKYSFDKLIGQDSNSTDITNSTQKLVSHIQKEFFEKNINTDYRYFENFVHFSSAQTRINNFDDKVSNLDNFDSQIKNLETISSSISSEDAFIKLEIKSLEDQKNLIIEGFDGYEEFLYSNPEVYDDHSRQVGIGRNAPTSASLYDEFNDDRLVNNTAEYIVKNPDNSEYIKFLDMIGQHFDLIWLYIKGMPSIQPPENRTNEGIAHNIVWHMLLSLGWDPESGTSNQDLLLNVFGEDGEEKTIETMSGNDRTQLIWRRLLNNLPYIFKKKGTEEAFRALLTCYGIPACIFKLREYGGIEYTTDITQDSLFIFDNCRFALKIDHDNEYLSFPWFTQSRALEFSVSFNKQKTFPEGSQYTLAICDDRWAVGVIRDRGTDWGKVYFTARDVSGSIMSTTTGKIPIFNGELFSILLRKDDVNPYFDLPTTVPSNTYIFNEIPSGSIDGLNTIFSISSIPLLGTQAVYVNGILQKPIIDYTIVGSTITLTSAPLIGDYILSNYEISSGGSPDFIYNEIPTGIVNGINTVFFLSVAAKPGKHSVFRNGILQKSSIDYTIVGLTLTFTSAPLLGDDILVNYEIVSGTFDDYIFNEIPSGVINGSNVVFVLSGEPGGQKQSIYRNGILQRPAVDYSIILSTITFVSAPLLGDDIVSNYEILQIDVDCVPTKYELFVKRSEDDRMIFEQSASMNMSESFNTTFKEGETIYLANFNLSSGSTDAFFGTMDQIQMWATPLSEDRFNNHVFFNEAYDSSDPTTTVDNLLLRLDFSEPKDLYSVTSQSFIENSSYNQNLITFVTASNFHDLSTISESMSPGCDDSETITIQTRVSGSFPWHFDEYETREVVKIPNFGANKFRSNKIRFESQELISNLSFDSRASVKSRDRNPADSTALGLFFTPVDLINVDILRFFGNFELANLIGNPAQIYDTEYKPLREFIPLYFKNGGGRVDFQSYLNLVKAYFDKSLFKHLESLAPARSKFTTGLLIEPTILERPKLQSKLIVREIHNNFSSSIDTNQTISSSIFPNLTDFVDPKTNSSKINHKKYESKIDGSPSGFNRILVSGTGSNTSVSNNFVDYIDDSLVDVGFGTLAVNGSAFFDVADGDNFISKEFKVEIIKIKKSRQSTNTDGSADIIDGNFETLNIVPIISGSFQTNANSRLLNGYYSNHFKFKRNLVGKMSSQTDTTTVDEKTSIPNGSSPVESNIVDRGSISVASQGSGVVLNSQ